jgi:predicted ATPase
MSLRAAGTELARPYFLGLLAEACAAAGHIEDGLAAVDEALALASTSAEGFCEPELHRVRAELLRLEALRDGSRRNGAGLAAADQALARAMAIARRRGFKSLALRIALTAIALRPTGPRSRAAYRILSDIYHSFTEGHGTADLRSARHLLASAER